MSLHFLDKCHQGRLVCLQEVRAHLRGSGRNTLEAHELVYAVGQILLREKVAGKMYSQQIFSEF